MRATARVPDPNNPDPLLAVLEGSRFLEDQVPCTRRPTTVEGGSEAASGVRAENAVLVEQARQLVADPDLGHGGWPKLALRQRYRSVIAASALRRLGYPDVSDLLGGYVAWAAATLPVSHGEQPADSPDSGSAGQLLPGPEPSCPT